MPLQNFVARNLPTIKAVWLNAVDALKFTVFDDAATKQDAITALFNNAVNKAFGRTALELNSAVVFKATDGSGVANTVTLTLTGPIGSPTIATGTKINFTAAQVNTGAVTVTVNGGAAAALVNQLGNACTGGELFLPVTVEWTGAAWRIIEGGISPALARTAAETTAAVVPVNYLVEPYNLYRYGTNTTPGTTDMSAAVQNCINATPASGTAWMPPDLISLGTTAITCSKSIAIIGLSAPRQDQDNSWDNAAGTIFWYKGTTGDALTFTTPNAVNSRVNLVLRNFGIRGARVSPGGATSGRCLVIDGRQLAGTSIYFYIDQVFVWESRREGIYITGAVYGGEVGAMSATDCGYNGYSLVSSGADPIGEITHRQVRCFANGQAGTTDFERTGVFLSPGASSVRFDILSCTENVGTGAVVRAGSFEFGCIQLESNQLGVAADTNQIYFGSAGGGFGLTSCKIGTMNISPGANYTGTVVNVTSDAAGVQIDELRINDSLSGGGTDLVIVGGFCRIGFLSLAHTLVATITAPGTYLGNTLRSFTPNLLFGGAATGMTYTTREGRYIVDGNVMDFWISIVLSAKGASAGSATITGLPYASLTLAGNQQALDINVDAMAATVDVANAVIGSNTSTIVLSRFFDGTRTDMADTDFNNTTQMYIHGRILINP